MHHDTKYNGWTNYETWLCNLHYDDFFTEQAQEAWDESETNETFTRDENAVIALKDIIESTVDEFTQESLSGSQSNAFVADLVNSALREVNYYEIAKAYIVEVDKETVTEEE